MVFCITFNALTDDSDAKGIYPQDLSLPTESDAVVL